MRLAPCLAALVAAALLGGCNESERDRVEDYIDDANAIQRRAAPAFQRANRSYAKFLRARLRGGRGARALERAEQTIRSARAEVAELDPPPEAERLHRLLLRIFDANIELARQTTQLGLYLPAAERALDPLGAIAGRLRRELAQSSDPAFQSAALARYERGIDRRLAALDRTDPPPLLAASHRAQVRRLTAAREVATDLQGALARQDAPAVARLLLEFRRLQGSASGRGALSGRPLRRYRRRQQEILAAVKALQRERRRLEDSLD